ncbi:MAG: TetR/AcrR family transcriptional regulator [Christensenellales bacterium]|nr:TetR/AcrR family transcriptional regulator [Christensenellales bacterium]
MNKSESKYFHTALRMNEALISLLEKKDLEFITVKEICETAGVNRSTFYLHYETISDLMNETVEMVDKRFLSYFSQRERDALSEMNGADLKELVLVSRAYLLPYLRFIRDNKHVYRAAFRNPAGMQAYARYEYLKNHILGPSLARFQISPESRPYYIAYYVEGIIAIVKEWLRRDCIDEVESISDIIENCVRPGSAQDGE